DWIKQHNEEVELEIKGIKQKGVWRLVGEEGVFDFEEYEDTAVAEKIIEHEGGDEPFSEVAFARKKEAMHNAWTAQSKAREAVSVKGPELGMEALLALVQNTASGQGSSSKQRPLARSRSRSRAGRSSKASSSSDESASDAEEGSKPSAKGANTKKVSAPSAPVGQGHGSRGGSGSGPRTALVLDATPAAPMQLDGRANRTLRRCQTEIDKLKKTLQDVDLKDKAQGPQATASKEYRTHCQKRVTTINIAVRDAGATIKAVDKSSNKETFETQLQELQHYTALSQAVVRLIQMMPAARPDPEEFIKVLSEVKKLDILGLSFGPGFQMKCLMARANESCLHGDHEKFTDILMHRSEEAQPLLSSMNLPDLRSHICTEVENRMLASMRAITTEELQLKMQGKASSEDTPNLHEATSLAKAVAKACADSDFLASDLQEYAQMSAALLDQHDIKRLETQTLKVKEKASEKLERVQGMIRFFLQHDVGKDLMSMAISRVQEGELEADFQALVRVAEKEVSTLACAAAKPPLPEASGCSLGPDVLAQAIAPAFEAVASLKACKFLKSKQSKKALGEDGTLPAESVASLEKQLSNAAVQLVSPDLSCTVTEHLLLAPV
ncbi:unnamed protein product, partial [Symbiodinium sp. CCMP2592]